MGDCLIPTVANYRQMRQLGFQNDEILSLMNQTMKGEKQ